MQTDYITSGAKLPPHIPYSRFLLTADMKLITKVVYAVVLDATMRSQTVDRHGRCYAALSVDDIAGMIDRTPAAVRKALNELEGAELVERMPTSYKTPDIILTGQQFESLLCQIARGI